MSSEEANKIIADFMGTVYQQEHNRIQCFTDDDFEHYFSAYSNNLDSLVPVWDKLKLDICLNIDASLPFGHNEKFYFTCDIYGGDNISSGWKQTAQEAAAISTAKVILNMEKECK